MISLPPLYGGNNSAAYGANNFGQIVGASETAALENNSNCAQEVLATQGALWQPLRYKHATALPPVAGDTDSSAYAIDDHGDAAGASGSCIDFPPNADELHPVLWRNGKTVALPTLGGTLDNAVNAINERGEMAGQSALTGNSTVHAAFWRSPRVITDLGTFPGDSYSLLFGINDEGQVVGGSGSQTNYRRWRIRCGDRSRRFVCRYSDGRTGESHTCKRGSSARSSCKRDAADQTIRPETVRFQR
ncbi:MAG: hypothetical protein ABSB70_12435 [Candidatus Velthaea sp.]